MNSEGIVSLLMKGGSDVIFTAGLRQQLLYVGFEQSPDCCCLMQMLDADQELTWGPIMKQTSTTSCSSWDINTHGRLVCK